MTILSENPQNIQSQQAKVRIQELISKYIAHWPWFILSLAFFLTLGGVYLWRQTPQYQISASILIKDNKKMGDANSSMLEELDLFSSTKVIENEIEILRSYIILEQVVKELNLQVHYIEPGRFHDKEIYNAPVKIEILQAQPTLYSSGLTVKFTESGRVNINGVNYPYNSVITEGYGSIRTTIKDTLLAQWDHSEELKIAFTPVAVEVNILKNNLGIKPSGKGTSVLNLAILHPSPEQGVAILNHLLTTYNLAAIADKNNLAGTTLSFIDDRLKLLSVDLREAEQAVETYKSSQGITNISAESQLFLQSVQQNDTERSRVDVQLSVLRNVEQMVLRKDGAAEISPASLGISDASLMDMVTKLTTTEAERTKALRTVKAANPIVLALDDQISALKTNIIDYVQGMRNNLEITRKQLMTENRRIENMIQSVPKKERELVDITRQQEIKNQLYIYLLSKREETAILYASTVADSRTIDPSRSSFVPVKPVKRVVMLAFFLIGLMCPLVFISGRELLYNKVESKEELEKMLKTPVAGEIPIVRQTNKVLNMSQSRSYAAEQFRSLRTNLSFILPGGGLRTILVTSCISGEGKSFLASNLGSAFAALNKSTIVLGFDLRRPEQHKIFGLENTEGLSNYLSGQASLSQIIRKVEQIPNLYVITSGYLPPTPQELLLGNTLPQLFEELKAKFDYIIIDTPPIGLVSDTKILNQYADIALYVVRQGVSPKGQLQAIDELKMSNQLHHLCVVLNGVKESKWYGYQTTYGSKKKYGQYYQES